MHLTGQASVDWSPERAASIPGARRVVDFDVERVVHVAGTHSLRWQPEAAVH